jgi:hypothetical protein
MATTLLQGVNKVFQQVGEISQASPVLTSLTDSARQANIDLCVQLWNNAVEYVQGFADLPGDVGSGTITLTTDTAEYSLAADFQNFVGDDKGDVYMQCASPNYSVTEYPGGYLALFRDQPNPSLFTGQPSYFVLNPVTTMVRFDKIPTSAENGQTLTYLYDKTITLAAYTDTFPIPDAAVNVLVDTVADVYTLKKKREPIGGAWKIGISEAVRITSKAAKDRAYA